MPNIYYCGFSGSRLIYQNPALAKESTLTAADEFILLPFDISDIEIGWDYFLLWKEDNKLYLSSSSINDDVVEELNKLITIPEHPDLKFKQAIPGEETISVLTHDHEIWLYKIYQDVWKKVEKFITSETDDKEYIIKIAQGRCTVALSNLGRAFNIPVALTNPDGVKFIDVACGFDHTLLLSSEGEVYSTGMGTRGALGHGDLEDSDEPKLIEALAGLKVVQIVACGWHNVVLTKEHDIYTWGWNNCGQLGLLKDENVIAIPTLIDFTDEKDEVIELNIIKVQCGNAFTICLTDTHELWGCGSNKYGQLGTTQENTGWKKFEKLKLEHIDRPVTDIKCREWGTCVYTEE